MTDEMINDLDPRFNNTFYRGLRKQEREMSSRWGLHNNLIEKSRKMISRAEELLASATSNRKRDALDLFMQDERAVPPAPASAWDKFKQRLDNVRSDISNYRPTWGFGSPKLRQPNDMTFEDPSKLYVETVIKGKRTVAPLSTALDNLMKGKEGWSYRFVSAGDNMPSHVELSMPTRSGENRVRQMLFPTAGTMDVGVQRNNGRIDPVRAAMSALVTDKGSQSYHAITPSVTVEGKDGDGNLQFGYRAFGTNLGAFLSGHNVYRNYGATDDRATQSIPYAGAPLPYDMREANSPHASRYLTQISLGTHPTGAALDIEESKQAMKWTNEYLAINRLHDEPAWRSQNVIGKGGSSTIGPIEPATKAGAITGRSGRDYTLELFKAHKHNFLTNKSRGSGSILYDKLGVRPTRYQLAQSSAATGAFSGPETSSAYFMKRWGFGEGQSFSVAGRVFIGEHQSTVIKGLRPDQLPQRVGDTYYANDRINYPMPEGGRYMPKGGSIGFSRLSMGNNDQSIITNMEWIAENMMTRMDVMNVSDLAYQTEAKNYSDKSVSTPVRENHPYFESIRNTFGMTPDMIHPLPDPGNRFTGKSEFLWMNQAAQPQQDKVRDTFAMLDQFYAELDAAKVGDRGMLSLQGGKVPGAVRRNQDGKYVAVADGREYPLADILNKTRPTVFDADEEMPNVYIGFNPASEQFAHAAARKYVLANMKDVEVTDIQASHWMVVEKAAQDIAKKKNIAVSDVQDSDIRAWIDSEFTEAKFTFYDQSKDSVPAHELDSFSNRKDGFWQLSYTDKAGVFYHPSNYIASRSRGKAGMTPEQLVSMKQLQPALHGFIMEKFEAGQFDNGAMGVIESALVREGNTIGRNIVDFHKLDFAAAVRNAQAQAGEAVVRQALSAPEGSEIRKAYDEFIARETLAHLDHQAQGGLIRMPNGTVLPGASDMVSYLSGTDTTAAPLGAEFMRFGQTWSEVVSTVSANPDFAQHLPAYMDHFAAQEQLLGQYANQLAYDKDVERAASTMDIPVLSGMVNERTGLPSDVAVVNEADYLDVLKRLGLDKDALAAEAERFRKGDAVGVGTMFPHGNKNTAFTGVRVLPAEMVQGWKGFSDLLVPAGGALMSPELVALFDKDADGDGFALYAAPGLKDQVNMMEDYVKTAWSKPSAEMQGIIKKLGFTQDEYEGATPTKPITGKQLIAQAVNTAESQARMGRDFNFVRDLYNTASIMSTWVLQNKSPEIANRFLTGAALFGQNIYQLSLDMDQSKDKAVYFMEEAIFGHAKRKGVYRDIKGVEITGSDGEYARQAFAGMLRMQQSHRNDPAKDREMYFGEGYSFLTGGQYHTGIIQEHAMMLTPRGLLDDAGVVGEVQAALADLFNAGDEGVDAAGRRILKAFTGQDTSDDVIYERLIKDYIFGTPNSSDMDAVLPTVLRAKLAQGSDQSALISGMDRALGVGKALKAFTNITQFVKGKGKEGLEAFENLGGTSYMKAARGLFDRFFGSRTAYAEGGIVPPGTKFTAGDGGLPEWVINSATGEMELIGVDGPQEYVATARSQVVPLDEMPANPALIGTVPAGQTASVGTINQITPIPRTVANGGIRGAAALAAQAAAAAPTGGANAGGPAGTVPMTAMTGAGGGGNVVMNLPGAEHPGRMGLHGIVTLDREVAQMGQNIALAKYDPEYLRSGKFLTNVDSSWTNVSKQWGQFQSIIGYRQTMQANGFDVGGFKNFMHAEAYDRMETFLGGKGILAAMELFDNAGSKTKAELVQAYQNAAAGGFVDQTRMANIPHMSEAALRAMAAGEQSRIIKYGAGKGGVTIANQIGEYAQFMDDNQDVLNNANFRKTVGSVAMSAHEVDAVVKNLDNFNKTLANTGKVSEMSATHARKFGENLSHIVKQFTNLKTTYDTLDTLANTNPAAMTPEDQATYARLSQPDVHEFMTSLAPQIDDAQGAMAQVAEQLRNRPEDPEVRQYRLRELLSKGGIAGERMRRQERDLAGPDSLYKDGLTIEAFGREFTITDPNKIDQFGKATRFASGLKSAMFNYSVIAGSTIAPLTKAVDPFFKSEELMEQSLGQLSAFGSSAYNEGPLAHLRQRRAQREMAGINFGEAVYRSYSGFFDSSFSPALASGLGYAASVAAPAATIGMLASSFGANAAVWGGLAAVGLGGLNILSGIGDQERLSKTAYNIYGQGNNVGQRVLGALSDPLSSLSLAASAIVNPSGYYEAVQMSNAKSMLKDEFLSTRSGASFDASIAAFAQQWEAAGGGGGILQLERVAYDAAMEKLAEKYGMSRETASATYTTLRSFNIPQSGMLEGTSQGMDVGALYSNIVSASLAGMDITGLATQAAIVSGQYPSRASIEKPLVDLAATFMDYDPGTPIAGELMRMQRGLEYGQQVNTLFEQAGMSADKYGLFSFTSRERGTWQDSIAFQEAEKNALMQAAQLTIQDPRAGALALGGVTNFLDGADKGSPFDFGGFFRATEQGVRAGSLYATVQQAFPNETQIGNKLAMLRDMENRDAFDQAEKLLTRVAGMAEQLNPLLRSQGLKEITMPYIAENATITDVQRQATMFDTKLGATQTAYNLMTTNRSFGSMAQALQAYAQNSTDPAYIGRMSQQALQMGSVYQTAIAAAPGIVPTIDNSLMAQTPELFASSMAGIQSRINIAANANPLAYATGMRGIDEIAIRAYTGEAAHSSKIAEMINSKGLGALGQMALGLNLDLSTMPEANTLQGMVDEFSAGIAIDPARLRQGYQYASLVGASAGLFEEYSMRNPSFNTTANLQSFMSIANMPFAQATTLQAALAGDPMAMSRAYAMAPGAAPVSWNQIDLRNGLSSTTFGLTDGQYNRIRDWWANQTSAQGAAFGAQLTDDMKLGSWGLQNQAQQIQFRAQMASYGIQAASARASWGFTSGGYTGLDAQGFAIGGDVAKAVGHGINGGNGMGKWQIDDAMTRLSREQQLYQYNRAGQELDFAGQNKDLQYRQFMEKWNMNWNWMRRQTRFQRREMNIGRTIQLTQRGWMAEDMATERARSELEFGWQQEDFDRNIRFARGRQKLDLMREKDRANIRFSLDQNQRDKQEDRFAQEAKWQDERFKREKEHFKETTKHQKEEMLMDKRHFEERMALEDARMDRQRQDYEREGEWMRERWALEDQRRLIDRQEAQINYNYQMASLGVAMQAAIDMEQNRKNQEGLAMAWKSISEELRLGFAGAEDAARNFINSLYRMFTGSDAYGDGGGGGGGSHDGNGPMLPSASHGASGGIRGPGEITVGEFGREIISTDTSVAILNNRTTEAYYAGAAAAMGGNVGNHSDELLKEVVALLKVIAKKSPATINATINTKNGEVKLGEYLAAIESRVRM